MIGSLLRNELRLRFLTPAWWMLAAGGWLICAWLLFAQLQVYQEIQPALTASGADIGVNDLLIVPILNVLALLLLVITPLLGMNAIAGERSSGRLAVLLSTPLSPFRLLLGKWLGLVVPLVLIVLAIHGMLSSLALGMQLEWTRLATSLAGQILLVALAAAISLACSAFTRQSGSAFAAALSLLIFLWLADGFLPQDAALYWFALSPHLSPALHGTLVSDDLAYFGILTFAAMALALIGLLRERETPPLQRVRQLLALLLLAGVLALGAALSQTHRHTVFRSEPVPQALLETLAAIQGPITITIWAPEYPLLRAQTEKLLRPLQEAHRDIELRWIDPQREPQLARQTGITRNGELRIEAMGRSHTVTEPDYSSLLRAFRHLARKGEPWIAVLQGNGEAPIDDSPQGLGAWIGALERHGYRIVGIDAAGPIPDNASLIVVAAPRREYAPELLARLQRHLSEGGRLLWLHETDGNRSLESLTGVQVLPGTLVSVAQTSGAGPLQLVLPLPRELTGAPAASATLDQAQALIAPQQGPWQIEFTLQTGANSWNETGPLRGQLQRNPLQGERSGPHTIGLLMRQDQARVAILGDSDLARDTLFGQSGNPRLLLSLVNWLTGNRIDTRTGAADKDIHWSPMTGAALAMFHLLIGPLLLGVSGYWIRRRRERA